MDKPFNKDDKPQHRNNNRSRNGGPRNNEGSSKPHFSANRRRSSQSDEDESRPQRPRRPRVQGSDSRQGDRRRFGDDSRPRRKPQQQQKAKPKASPQTSSHTDTVRLNKYIAHAGICSRREADKLIEAGSVMVNGQVVTTLGYQVKPTDVVSYGGETLRSEAKRYFLMNKPKGYITTLDDPQERKTVMMLIDGACRERIYPVGRLDRNTTGLLLFTNDGELAKKLTHPSTGVYKIYHVELNRPVTREDMKRMLDGFDLEDGFIKVDDVQYVENANDRRVVGVELHSGRNRIVRRIFEYLGYEVHKLDRVVFAGLTKKDLPRGRYRELTEKEVGFLKMI